MLRLFRCSWDEISDLVRAGTPTQAATIFRDVLQEKLGNAAKVATHVSVFALTEPENGPGLIYEAVQTPSRFDITGTNVVRVP